MSGGNGKPTRRNTKKNQKNKTQKKKVLEIILTARIFARHKTLLVPNLFLPSLVFAVQNNMNLITEYRIESGDLIERFSFVSGKKYYRLRAYEQTF